MRKNYYFYDRSYNEREMFFQRYKQMENLENSHTYK